LRTVQAVAPPSKTALVAAGIVTAACTALFLVIAEDVLDGGGLVSRDESVLTWFVDHRGQVTIAVAKAVSLVGSFVGLVLVGIVLALWLRSRGTSWWLATAPVISLAIASLAATWAKHLFGRPRPPVPVRATTVTLSAFPSGHATDAAAFFVAAAMVVSMTLPGPRRRLAVIGAGLLAAGLVGVSRLVLGVHWLSDVVAGWALGTAVAIAVVTIAWVIDARRTPPREPGRDNPCIAS
jgi:membrane-associated phospholipid phosphatase